MNTVKHGDPKVGSRRTADCRLFHSLFLPNHSAGVQLLETVCKLAQLLVKHLILNHKPRRGETNSSCNFEKPLRNENDCRLQSADCCPPKSKRTTPFEVVPLRKAFVSDCLLFQGAKIGFLNLKKLLILSIQIQN